MFSFAKENTPFGTPRERRFFIASKQFEEARCLPMLLPARGEAALQLLYDLPLLLLSAVAQRVQFFELLSCNGGVKGQSPLRSLGGPRGHSLT